MTNRRRASLGVDTPARPRAVTESLPIKIVAANLRYGWRSRRRARRHLEHLLASPTPVVIGVQEAKNVVLAAVLGVMARVMQRTTSPALAGSAIVTRGVVASRFRLFLGGVSSATLPRWIARATVRVDGSRLVVFSAHVPPARAGQRAQLRYLTRLKRRTDRLTRRGVAWAVCIDANRSIEQVAQMLGGRAYGVGIVGVIVSELVQVVDHGVDRFGVNNGLTDHPAPWVEISGIKNKEWSPA